jgi:hypothetical protein
MVRLISPRIARHFRALGGAIRNRLECLEHQPHHCEVGLHRVTVNRSLGFQPFQIGKRS